MNTSVLYKYEIKSVTNGQSSPWFKINRGCGQGHPLSPNLFILCTEIVASRLEIQYKWNSAEYSQ